MIGLVAVDLDRIRAACEQRGVSFLELVGSAARDDFDPSRSDIDVLVDFPDHTPDLFGGYDVVDPRLVYGLARTRLPALLAALRAAR